MGSPQRPAPPILGVLVLLSLTAAACAGRGSNGPTFASDSGKPIDGIPCETTEQVLFHVHSHLAVFDDGKRVEVPEGIGIAPPRTVDRSQGAPFVTEGSCFYWLHTHTADGIVHIESPEQRVFTLGDFFDLWGRPLGPAAVAGARGDVIAYVNGVRTPGDPGKIELGDHTLVQLDVGGDVPPQPFTFPDGL